MPNAPNFNAYPANTFTADRGEDMKRRLTTDGYLYPPENYDNADDMPGADSMAFGQTVIPALVPITDHGKIDRRKVRFNGAEGSGPVSTVTAGTAVVDVWNIAVPPGQAWFIERAIVFNADAGAGPFSVRLYETSQVTRLDDIDILATITGQRGEGDYSNPIIVQEGYHVLAQFLGLTAASASRVGGILMFRVEQV